MRGKSRKAKERRESREPVREGAWMRNVPREQVGVGRTLQGTGGEETSAAKSQHRKKSKTARNQLTPLIGTREKSTNLRVKKEGW